MKFNELLASRYNEGLSALLGLSEQEGITSVAPELMPMFVVEGERAEHSYVKQERLCCGYTQAAADAANFSYGALYNPIGSNAIITCTKIICGRTTLGDLHVGILGGPAAAFPLGTLDGSGMRDTRWVNIGAPSAPTGQLRRGVNAGNLLIAGATLTFQTLAANSPVVIDLDWVLSPGFGVAVGPQAINAGFAASFVWRERAMLPEENGSS